MAVESRFPQGIITALLFLLLLLLVFFELSEARPMMKDLKVKNHSADQMKKRLNLGAIKRSGPSPSGPGHRSITTSNFHASGAGAGFGHFSFSRMHH